MPLTLPTTIKTLIVDLSVHYGGSTSRVLSLMKQMPSEEIVLAGLKFGAITQQATELGLPVRIVGTSKTDPKILSNLIKIIHNENIQVLDSQNIQSKFWASLAARQTNTPLVSTIHSWYANEHGQNSLKGKFYTFLELSTNKNLALYITVSEKDRQSLLRAKISNNNINLIYNAVNVPPLPNRQWLKNKLNLPENTLICLAVGRLVPVKGYDILVEAVKLALPYVPNLVCVIIGEGVSKAELNTQITKYGLEKIVHLIGFYDRASVMEALISCDIFAMPSRYEGTPIALLEAAGIGCPIIASESGGIPELVKNEEHALLVPAENTKALAESLIRLCKDRDFARRLGYRAQQRIRENFSLEDQILKTRSAYKKAVEIYNSKG